MTRRVRSYGRLAWIGGTTLVAAALPVPVVIAADYLSIQSAQHSAFSQADRFEEISPAPSTQQQQAIAALAGPQPPHGKLRVWRAFLGDRQLGYFFFDEVIGRQDLISYTVGIDSTGSLGAVEILSYRESHGAEVRNPAWRKQFAGRNTLAALRFGTDIKNIAGATLSSEHITQGVRWLMALWQVSLAGAAT